MPLATEWRQDFGNRYGLNDWTFDSGSELFMGSTSPFFLADGVDVVRNIVQAHLALSVPVANFGAIDGTEPLALSPIITLNVTDTVTQEWIADRGVFLPNHSIIGTSQLTCTSWNFNGTQTAMVYQYRLPETLDVHGQRHVPASTGTAMVTLDMEIANEGPWMSSPLGASFQATTWMRTLFQQATT